MKRFASPRALAATLILSLSLAGGGSLAAPPRGDHSEKGPDFAHGHAAWIFQRHALGRLHDELKLDARQEALWKEAKDPAGEGHDAIRERLRKKHAEIKALLDQPGVDLRAVVGRMDELRAEGLKQRDATRDRWLAVYDSLNAEQKEKARLFFKDGIERAKHLGKKTKERSGRGHHRHDPRPATAPAASPAR
ncbi:MAG: periplasmic heavy metal sensor [Candidatus Accumulibacter sp.]|nr:periplasmic heavy metal sensor [Accumulibacter sp.]